MSEDVSFFVPGPPKTAGSKKAFVDPKTGRAIITDDVGRPGREWRTDVRAAAAEALGGRPPLDGPLILRARFLLPRPASHYGSGRNAHRLKPAAPDYPATRPDLTKLLRAAEDALLGLAYADDARIVGQLNLKEYADEGRIGVELALVPVPAGARVVGWLEVEPALELAA